MAGGGNLGAAGPSTPGDHYNVLDFLIQQAIAQLSTSTVVKVVKAPYDENGNAIPPDEVKPIGYIDVQPLVNMVDGEGNSTPHGTVYKVKYHRPESGNGAFITEPKVGDQGFLVSADRDTSIVRRTNAQGNPGSGRVMNKSDGTYYGVCQGSMTPTQFFKWLSQGFKIADSFGNTIQGTANGVLINGALINKQGDVITKAGHDLDTHVHTGVSTGSSNTGPPA